MALSNWDTLALDADGKLTNGTIKSTRGVVISIYKNWIYVYDEEAWQERDPYTKPCVMEIHEGDLSYKDVKILAERGPQNGVYCFVCIMDYNTKQKSGMIGIGCYGFESDTDEWVGVKQESLDYLKHLCQEKWADDLRFYLRVKPEEIGFSGALRFNQGDEYFAKALGGETPATPIGEAQKPTIMKLL